MFAIGLLDALADHGDEDLVRHQAARSHDLAGAETDFRARRDFGAKHIAGRDLGDAVPGLQAFGLRAFPCTRWT
jgi:hypothetical protein